MLRAGTLAVLTVTTLCLGSPSAHAGLISYSADILSTDRYPQVLDSYLMRINDRGVAAGYVATASVAGPYQATTYSSGQFRTLGIQSVGLGNYFGLATGINNQGDVVGQVTNADGTETMYVARGGVAHALTLPPDSSPQGAGFTRVFGIGDNGLAYGQYTDRAGNAQVFTASGSVASRLAVSLPGFEAFSLESSSHLLSGVGILGVYASSATSSASPALLYDTRSGAITQLATPAGYTYDDIFRVSTTGVFGAVTDANFSVLSLASWNLDGTFRGLIGVPSDVPFSNVHFNDRGQAIALTTDDRLMYFDGSGWSSPGVAGLGGYTITEIDDFNDRGDFVGLTDNGHGFAFGIVATAVPEPSSLALLACGGLGVLVAASRSRKIATG